VWASKLVGRGSAGVVAEHILFSETTGSPCEPRSDVREPLPNAYAETPIRFFCGAGTIGATKPTLMPVTKKTANQYTRQSVTTGLIAGSDLVIVPISGVIKKYK
jgi:hypothetical protein